VILFGGAGAGEEIWRRPEILAATPQKRSKEILPGARLRPIVAATFPPVWFLQKF